MVISSLTCLIWLRKVEESPHGVSYDNIFITYSVSLGGGAYDLSRYMYRALKNFLLRLLLSAAHLGKDLEGRAQDKKIPTTRGVA